MRFATIAFALVTAAACVGCRTKGTLSSSDAVAQPASRDASFAGRAYAGDAKLGEQVFNTNCSTCHGVDGRAGGVGPSLIDENVRQDLPRTIVWIENPNPPMPRLYPSPLTEQNVEDVAAFVQSIH